MSAPTISQVNQWDKNIESLRTLSQSVDAKVDIFDRHTAKIASDIANTMYGTSGKISQASEASAANEKHLANQLAQNILDISHVINTQSFDFIGNVNSTAKLARTIAGLGYYVADNGTVSPPPILQPGHPKDVRPDLQYQTMEARARAQASVHQRSLAEALQATGASDSAFAKKVKAVLTKLKSNASAAADPKSMSSRVQDILSGKGRLPTDSKELKKFWDTLSSAEKEALWRRDKTVGSLNGIPVADRDHFNRQRLAELKNTSQQRLKDLQQQRDHAKERADKNPTNEEAMAKYLILDNQVQAEQKRLDGYNTVDGSLNTGGKPKFLMVIGDNDRAAISVNNPDTADNVATYVPGMGSELNNINNGVDRAEALVNAAARADPSEKTAAIAWYDYDAPSGVTEAAGGSRAAHAAEPLADFQEGLRTTHEGLSPSHNTVIGHSYGGLVVGESASEGRTLNADELVFVATPGVGGPHNASELSLTGIDSEDSAKHVWATVSQYDPILLTEGIHGRNPHFSFGAQDFQTKSTPGSWYKLGWNPSDHSSYWNEDNEGLNNQGRIIVGNNSEVTPR